MSPHLALSNSRQYIAVKLGPARPGGNSSIFLSERTVLLGGFRRNVCTAAILRERPAAHGKKPWAECRRRCTSYTSPRSPFNSPPCDCQRGEDSRQNTISEAEYHEFADSTMVKLLDSLDEFYEQVQVDKMDISFSDGVLNLSLGDLGTYVINKQPPNRQIWLSSPVRLVQLGFPCVVAIFC